MAESRSNRTEKPSARRLQKSREKGQVPRTPELPAALALGGFLLFARVFGPGFTRTAGDFVRSSLSTAAGGGSDPDLTGAFRAALGTGVLLAAPVTACVAFGSLVGQFSQGGFVLSGEPLRPSLERLNPVRNLSNLFSAQKGVTLLRTLLMLAAVATICWATLVPEFDRMVASTGQTPEELFALTAGIVTRVFWKFFVFALTLAGADWLWRKYDHLRGLRMTRQEVRDERRESEGDPQVKGRQRARALVLARRRMMNEVPKADVVVVNPTHCAVALKYDAAKGGAPRVVAKGVDLVAARIRAIAEEHRVPIYEDKPLAWSLYKAVEIGREIPADLFRAVAGVLAHVYRLRRGRAAGTGPAPAAGDAAPESRS